MPAPISYTDQVLVIQYAVGTSVTEGEAVVLTTDTSIDDAGGASDLAVGIALATSSTAGAMVDVAMFGWAVQPVLVGTGGATRGTKAILAADGFTDAPTHDSSGGTDDAIYGVFLQSASATNWAGLLLTGASNRGSA